MNYTEAAIAYKKQWLDGKYANSNQECVFPYNLFYIDDTFVSINVSVEDCVCQMTDDVRVNKYINKIKENIDLGPAWVLYGKRLREGEVIPFWHKKLYVLEGNHRVVSRKKLGIKETEAIIPLSNYTVYTRDINGY